MAWLGELDARHTCQVELLSPFLPLAKALKLFLLDFDTYLEARDAEVTARAVVPAVLRFFGAGSQG